MEEGDVYRHGVVDGEAFHEGGFHPFDMGVAAVDFAAFALGQLARAGAEGKKGCSLDHEKDADD